MEAQHFGKAYGGKPPANYQRYFVPTIGAPLAKDLVEVAALRPGERVLDVACGTGVVARLAVDEVGAEGSVAGLDANPGMLAVARATTPDAAGVVWHEASAEDMSLEDDSFDVALCQMGLQFVPDKPAALREIRRVLVPGGRLVLNLPGPTPPLMGIMAEELARHVSEQAAGFVHQVFSFHDIAEIQRLVDDAGFRDVTVQAATKSLPLPAPKEFLWQYIHSTPLAGAVAHVGEETLGGLERDVLARWHEQMEGDALTVDIRVVVAMAAA